CPRPRSTFSVTDFASLRRGNTATATFVGTFQRGNGAGGSCRGRVSRASTLPTSVRGRIDQEIAARQFAHPRWPSPAESEWHPGWQKDHEKCSRPCATGASYWPGGWWAQRQDADAQRRAGSRLSIQQDDWPLDRRGNYLCSSINNHYLIIPANFVIFFDKLKFSQSDTF